MYGLYSVLKVQLEQWNCLPQIFAVHAMNREQWRTSIDYFELHLKMTEGQQNKQEGHRCPQIFHFDFRIYSFIFFRCGFISDLCHTIIKKKFHFYWLKKCLCTLFLVDVNDSQWVRAKQDCACIVNEFIINHVLHKPYTEWICIHYFQTVIKM